MKYSSSLTLNTKTDTEKLLSDGDTNGIRTHKHFGRKRTFNHLAKLGKFCAVMLVLTFTVHLTICNYRVTYPFQSEYTLYSYLYVKELLAIECRFTLKCVLDMIITYNQMHRTDKYSQHSSIIWSVWLSVRLRTKWL